MRRGFRIVAAIGAATLFCSLSALAQNAPVKPHLLSQAEERAWIRAVRSHKTGDGATVEQVLRIAEKMRPREFKAGALEIGYNGATGDPEAVGIDYWIGAKRLKGDALINLGYSVRKAGGGLEPRPFSWPISQALERGRDAFLLAVDEAYSIECVNPETQRKTFRQIVGEGTASNQDTTWKAAPGKYGNICGQVAGERCSGSAAGKTDASGAYAGCVSAAAAT